MNEDYTYCTGQNCPDKDSCRRYVEGQNVKPSTIGFWWMTRCFCKEGYIPQEPALSGRKAE